MITWVLYTILYAFFNAFYEGARKKAVGKNTIYEVLAIFSSIAFVLVFIITRDAFTINYMYLPVVLLKASVIVIAWILGVKVLEKMQISLYSMIKISSIIFSVILSFIVLGEQITIITLIGMSIVIAGLILVNKTTKKERGKEKDTSFKLVLILLVSCLLNSISSIIDKKVLMHITSSQLQFWFLLFLSIYYWIILLIKNRKKKYTKNNISRKINNLKNNYWIPIASICLVVGDRFLFMANATPDSQVIVITMLKQLSVIISILIGKFMFKEKDTIKKLLYSILIILGIGVMFI